MSKKTGVFKVYFEDNGDLMYAVPYVSRWVSSQPGYTPPQHKTEDNHVFHDQLEYVDYFHNGVTFKSLTSGRKYHMFRRHFHDMMKTKLMIHNVIEGDFTFAKHGSRQSIKLVVPKPTP